MRALVFHGRRDLRVEERPVPDPGDGEVLLQVRAVGVCGTDAHEYASGPHMFPVERRHPVTGHVGPMIPGHELAGRVVATGRGVTGLGVGAMVACGAGMSCGACDPCRAGRTNLCRSYATVGLQRDGGLAEYCAAPASICVDVGPYGLSDDLAALGQPMAIAVHSYRRGRVDAGAPVAVVGAGGIGAFLTFAATAHGHDVTVVDLDATRLDVARGLGAHAAVNPETTAGERFPVVFEVSGAATGLDTALGLLDPGGRLVLVGLHGDRRPMDLRRTSLAELELVGTNAHVVATDLPKALELLASRDMPWSDVAPVALRLGDVVRDALAPIAAGRAPAIKTLVDPWADEPRATDVTAMTATI